MRCFKSSCAFVAFLFATAPSWGINRIDEPAESGQVFYTSNIAPHGYCDMGLDVRVKIRATSVTGTILAESPLIDVPMMSTQWEYNFAAPMNGWSVGADRFCVLYNSTGMKLDDNEFAIVDQI